MRSASARETRLRSADPMAAPVPAARAARRPRCQVGISDDHIGGTRNSRLEFIARRGERGEDEIAPARMTFPIAQCRRPAFRRDPKGDLPWRFTRRIYTRISPM